MRSNLFAPENQEQESAQPGLRLQNSKMLKIELDGEVLARQGSMVAYKGDVRFEAKGAGGLGNFVKQKLTGEGVPLTSGEKHSAAATSTLDVLHVLYDRVLHVDPARGAGRPAAPSCDARDPA